MNRREILKFSLLSPLLGLFKSRKRKSAGLTNMKRAKGLHYPVRTTGTSNEGAYFIDGERYFWDGVRWHNHNPPPDIKWFSLKSR